MSALSDLVYGKNNERGPWPKFTDKYPVKVKTINGKERPLLKPLNKRLERDIRDAGDHLQTRTAAKCLMTRWDMHDVYKSFEVVGKEAIKIAQACPVATRTDTAGEKKEVPLYIKESWGLIYQKWQEAKVHNHWPSLWSYTYCVYACEFCSPLVFPTSEHKLKVMPKPFQLIVFPAWIMHEVPRHDCDHERIMVAGNLNIDMNNDS